MISFTTEELSPPCESGRLERAKKDEPSTLFPEPAAQLRGSFALCREIDSYDVEREILQAHAGVPVRV